jgi:hypothetical protein
MKKYFVGLLLCSAALFTHAQTPLWSWAKNNGGGATDFAYGTATDTFGNVYYCGSFYGNNAKFGTSTLISAGIGDGFICKYDAGGNFQWVHVIGGPEQDACEKVAVSAHGDIFVTGYSEGDFSADSTIFFTSKGEADGFIAKYNNSGDLQWINQFGGPKDDYSYSVAVDSKGRCAVTGRFEHSITIGSVVLTSQNDSLYDLFVAKFDKKGNVLWATSAGGSSPSAYVYPNDITMDASNNIFISGTYTGPVTFGDLTLYSAEEAFLVKLNSNGKFKMAVDAGSRCYYTYLATDASSNIYVTGSYGPYGYTSVIGNITLVTNGPYMDIYIAKFNSSGAVQWVKTGGSSQNDYAGGIAVDPAGNAWISGYVKGSPAVFGSKSFTGAGNDDIYVAGYDATGNIKWLAHAGGSDVDNASDLAYDGKNTLYVTGNFKAQTKFGSINLTASSPSADVFIAALNISGLKVEAVTENQFTPEIYPNPVTSVLLIRSAGNEEVRLRVFDAAGKLALIPISKGGSGEISVDVSVLSPGLYFLEIRSGAKTSTTKFLKQ